MKKLIHFLVKIYLKRNIALLSAPDLSFGDKDYVYVWTDHKTAEKVYKAILGVLEKERVHNNVGDI